MKMQEVEEACKSVQQNKSIEKSHCPVGSMISQARNKQKIIEYHAV